MISEAPERAGEVDAVKVAALREAIARGEYRPDPDRIAEGLISEALALGE